MTRSTPNSTFNRNAGQCPNSGGPSTRGSHELELLFYAFDWAGSGVPQVMEVYCDSMTGQVVEITLAFPTL